MPQTIFEAPASQLVVITPDDAEDLASVPRALWIGGAGNLDIIAEGDTVAVTLVAVPAGTLLPVRVTRVLDTDTTATLIVGLF